MIIKIIITMIVMIVIWFAATTRSMHLIATLTFCGFIRTTDDSRHEFRKLYM